MGLMKNKGLRKGLSLMLCLLLVIGMLPITAYGWDTYVECEYCGSGCGDDYICSGGDHCSEDSGRDCYDEHHCLECGECEANATDWCEDCHMCAECAQSNGCHCPDCGICGVDAGTLCENCGKCYECGGECSEGTDHLCVECHENEGVSVCESCGACGLEGNLKLCEECGQCYECGGECSSGDEHMCLECHLLYGSACPECWKCSAEYADEEYCPDCGTCMDCAGNHCMLCFRCENCVELCERCNEQCVDCHWENDLGPDDEMSPCPYCGKCKQDGTAFCYECGTCEECMDICEECGLCTDCTEAMGLHCTECGECGEVNGMCADGGDHCVDCCEDNEWLCPDCGGCVEALGLEQCRDCMRCEDCGELCDICGGFCIECAIEEEALHCPDCGACYEGDGVMHCYECMACENCVGEICAHDLCADCGATEGIHCPDCGVCNDYAGVCSECGRCETCAGYCADCDMCFECAVEEYLHCKICNDCAKVKRLGICGWCGECENCSDDFCVACGGCGRCIATDPEYQDYHCPDCRRCFSDIDRCEEGCGRCTDCCVCDVAAFRDVPETEYYFSPVRWAVKRGITMGTGAGLFSPNETCTRAQVVTFLWRCAGEPNAKNSSGFADVPKDAYYYTAVCWAVEQGITVGTSATTFGPNEDCTRGQIVTFLWRFQNCPIARGDNPFTDVKAEDYFHDAVVWAVEEGITKGTGGTLFSPNEDCTRGQIVTFLYRSAKPLSVRTQPADYQMTSSQEDAEFTVSVVGGTGPYTYEWVLCCDTEEIRYQPELTYDTSSTFSVEISDYDFDEYRDIGVYCIITDGAGNSVETKLAEVFH